MKRITADDLDEAVFINDDGTVLDPAITPHVLIPDPKPPEDQPCRLWLVIKDERGFRPTEMEMTSSSEAQEACDAFNLRMGLSQEEADRIILASISGGTA
ncbi:MAG: hypothetical protein OXP75_07075 [Rhodospirillales bacterium]|nr:hypothetical protein [Rhodospirillales bacterium]